MSPADFLLVEAERYRSIMKRARDPDVAARWACVVEEYEQLAKKAADAFGTVEVYAPCGRVPLASLAKSRLEQSGG